MLTQACLGAKEKIGIVDKNKVLQQSKYYQQVQEIEQKLALLEEKLSVQRAQSQEKLLTKEQELNEKMQTTMNAKLKEKQDELQNKIAENNKEFLEGKQKEMQSFVQEQNQQFNSKIEQYNKQSNNSAITQAQIKQMQDELDAQKLQIEQKIKDKDQEILKQIEDKLSAERAEAGHELDSYLLSERDKMQEQMKKEFDDYAQSILGTDEVQKNQLEKQHQELIANVGKKIDDIINNIAKQKDISVIFNQVVANVQAIDLNKEVVEALNKQ